MSSAVCLFPCVNRKSTITRDYVRIWRFIASNRGLPLVVTSCLPDDTSNENRIPVPSECYYDQGQTEEGLKFYGALRS